MGLESFKQHCGKLYRRHIADAVKGFRRQARRAVTQPRLALDFRAFRKAIERRDWEDAHRRLMPLAGAAEQAGDTRLLSEMVISAERLCEYEASVRWANSLARLENKIAATEWRGEDLPDATLLVRLMETEKQGAAVGLNMAGYVAEVARRARFCRLVVEKRLTPLFARTLPEVEVLPFPAASGARDGTRLVTANALTLKTVLGSAPDTVRGRFLPLRPDAAVSATFRERYRAGRNLPLVGISWWSSHHGKDLPEVEDWAALVRSVNALFVDIQYGYDNLAAARALLKMAAPDRLITDDSVDQMTDMDRFAAQLGALDAVVTISNTGAHLAGGLGVPVFLIRDDWFRRIWPVRSDCTPWYPHTRVHGKEGRAWREVFVEIQKQIGK